jgi:proline-specific peptidase
MKVPGEVYAHSGRVYRGLEDLTYPYHDHTIMVTGCGRICFNGRKVNLSHVFAGQSVGVTQVGERIGRVTFMHYDLGYFDNETCRLEPIDNPFGPKVLPMCRNDCHPCDRNEPIMIKRRCMSLRLSRWMRSTMCCLTLLFGVMLSAGAAGSGFVHGADGVRLYYRTIGSGTPRLVVLHGGPGSNMNAVWPDLEPLGSGRSVLLYDQRGAGRSPVISETARLTAAHHVRDLEALRRHFGIRRMTIIGESWGSGLAILYAAAHPDAIEKLVLVGPMPPTRALMEQRLDESDATMAMRSRLAAIRRTMPDVPDPIETCREFFRVYTRQFFAQPDNMSKRRGSSCDAPAEGVRNYFVVNEATLASLGDYDLRPSLRRVAVPALVVEGENSIPSTVTGARAIADALPHGTLALIPNAGHYPQVERPDVFFPIVERFLGR